MRYDYHRNRMIDGSPGVNAIATRFRRAGILLRAGRWTEDDCQDFVLRDFPFHRRIASANYHPDTQSDPTKTLNR